MENVFAEILLGGLGIAIIILSFTKWSRNRIITLVIGVWFLAMAVSLFVVNSGNGQHCRSGQLLF